MYISELKKRVEQSPDNELYRFSLAKAHFDAGNWEECISQLEVALKKKADWMAAVTLLARAHQALGHISEARSSYLRAVELATKQGHDTAREEITALMHSMGG
jgi:Tfp pilus assembly protein PilF